MAEEIAVSVICNAYNHAPYIGECLEGFVCQKTRFPIEILVHDDASTDGTADIIRRYEQRYPGLILPVYETENQFALGHVNDIQYARVRGKYVAYCEGDDFWTDPDKLQRQVDALEAHPELDICAHRATRIDEKGRRSAVAPRSGDGVIPAEEVIAGGGYYVATSSLMVRAALNECIPAFRRMMMMDYTLQIHGALRGGMLFLDDDMSVYRYRTPGSWSALRRDDLAGQRAHAEAACAMLARLDRETGGLYREVIARRTEHYRRGIAGKEFRQCLREGDYRAALGERYGAFFHRLPPIKRLGVRLFAGVPWAGMLYRAARRQGNAAGAEGSKHE